MHQRDISILLSKSMEHLSTKERVIANDIIQSPLYSLVKRAGKLCVKTKDGKLYHFDQFVKQKCNCQ